MPPFPVDPPERLRSLSEVVDALSFGDCRSRGAWRVCGVGVAIGPPATTGVLATATSSARALPGSGPSGSSGPAGVTTPGADSMPTDRSSVSTRWLPVLGDAVEPDGALLNSGSAARADAGMVVVKGTIGDDRIAERLTWLGFPTETS